MRDPRDNSDPVDDSMARGLAELLEGLLFVPPGAAGYLAYWFATYRWGWESDTWLWIFIALVVVAVACPEILFFAYLLEKDSAQRARPSKS